MTWLNPILHPICTCAHTAKFGWRNTWLCYMPPEICARSLKGAMHWPTLLGFVPSLSPDQQYSRKLLTSLTILLRKLKKSEENFHTFPLLCLPTYWHLWSHALFTPVTMAELNWWWSQLRASPSSLMHRDTLSIQEGPGGAALPILPPLLPH